MNNLYNPDNPDNPDNPQVVYEYTPALQLAEEGYYDPYIRPVDDNTQHPIPGEGSENEDLNNYLNIKDVKKASPDNSDNALNPISIQGLALKGKPE